MVYAKSVKPSASNVEEVLQYIGKHYVNVDPGRKRSANKDLNRVLLHVTNALKKVSPLFKAMFETFLYAGSSYDGLKTGKPDEFDIDFKLYLPAIVDVQVSNSDKHRYVHVCLKDWERLKKDKILYAKFRELEKFIDDEYYLSHVKIKQWMHRIVTKAINKLNKTGKLDPLDVTLKISGPAVTLIIKNTKNPMTVDLVPVFRIEDAKWPQLPVKQNTYYQKDFVVVPKPPKAINKPLRVNEERYWQLSFPEQEMEHMWDYNYLKPALRFIKKLRDTRSHNIPSYFIKNIFLWEINNPKRDKLFWRKSMTIVFMEMLKTYRDYLKEDRIRYFWDENHDLIEAMSSENIMQITKSLDRMIKNIEKLKNEHPIIVAKCILPEEDYEKVCKELNVQPVPDLD